jgi:hypothetical protein
MNALDHSLVKLLWIKIIGRIRLNSCLFVRISDNSRLRLPSALAPKYTGCLTLSVLYDLIVRLFPVRCDLKMIQFFSDYCDVLQGQLWFTHD